MRILLSTGLRRSRFESVSHPNHLSPHFSVRQATLLTDLLTNMSWRKVEVYFGWSIPHEAPDGGFVEGTTASGIKYDSRADRMPRMDRPRFPELILLRRAGPVECPLCAPIAVLPARSRLAPFAECSLSVRWLREAHVAKHFGVEKPTQELRSFFARWSIKFSAEYDEAKGRQASGVPSSNSSKLRTLS